MRVESTPIPGIKLIHLEVKGDARGFFIERFHAERFAEHGLPHAFAQDNHSRSRPGILRGCHWQHTPPQGKLVGCVRGKIWDVGVDMRPKSPTFGQHFAAELSDTNGALLWLPAGIAHGFCVLGDEPADVLYKVTAPYAPSSEGGVRFDDPDLNIPWPIKNPTISERDTHLPSFAEYKKNPPNWDNV